MSNAISSISLLYTLQFLRYFAAAELARLQEEELANARELARIQEEKDKNDAAKAEEIKKQEEVRCDIVFTAFT